MDQKDIDVVTDEEMQAIAHNRKALREAQAAFNVAAERLSGANSLAKMLPDLRAEAGTIAARAFSGTEADAVEARDIAEKIAEAEKAAAAVPTLQRERDTALTDAEKAQGALNASIHTSTMNAARRAMLRYHELALIQVQAIGIALAAVERLNKPDLMSEMQCFFLQNLQVPAPPLPLRLSNDGAVLMNARDTLLAALHPELNKAEAHARTLFTRMFSDL